MIGEYHWSMRLGKKFVFGLTAFQFLSLGMTALGVGIQAATQRDAQQPRRTEQEDQLQRISQRMAEIRAVRQLNANQQQVSNMMVKMLNTSSEAVRNKLVTKTGQRAALLQGMGG